MKKLLLATALGLAAFVGTAAQAADATSTFNVGLTLTPKCYINMVTGTPADVATTDVALTYSSFQGTDADGSTSFKVRCTSTLGYGIAVTSDTGTIAGIDYYLKLVSGTTPSYVTAVGGGSLTGESGNGSDKSYSIGVRALKNQAGTCSTAAPGTCTGSNVHTVTVSY